MATAKEENRRDNLIIPTGDEPKTEEQPTNTTESMQLLTTEALAAMQAAIRGQKKMPQEEKQETKETLQEEQQAEPKAPTISAELLTAARGDMTLAILEVQRAYGLPAYITDVIVSACLSDIRDCANKELISK